LITFLFKIVKKKIRSMMFCVIKKKKNAKSLLSSGN
jgi:hypothetical protein